MNLDDPKFTAYALNELTDPVERAEVEAWLTDHPEGRAFIAETKATAGYLSENLRSGPMVGLTDEQRAAILEKQIIPFRKSRKQWSMIGLAALAACLALGPLLPWTELLRLRESAAPTVAVNEKPMTLQMPREEAQISSREIIEFKRLAPGDSEIPAKLDDGLLAGAKAQEGLVDAMKKEVEQVPGADGPSIPVPSVSVLAATPAPASSVKDSTISGFTQRGKGRAGGGGRLGKFKNERSQLAGDARFASSADKDLAYRDDSNTESYDSVTENDFLSAKENPLSTFSIDVDTASYANIRRFINDEQLPPKGAVRIEEMLNYFSYNYARPVGDAPFSTNLEVADCPWQPEHRLVRIGLRGKEIPAAERKPANLVFLIDVSGSMDEPNKLPLLKQSLRLLVDQLGENDKVALTVYAGSSGLVLPSTANKEAIRTALENLQPGGSTNGASGIELAYEQASANFIKDGVNRVILATDGDFNVGVTNQSDLVNLITEKARSGVFLSVLGFGTGNVKDSTMEKLADKGNGNYAYIDGIREGKKVLVEQMGGTLVTIAKDVKIQVEFNPALVGSYRLIGYENRSLKKEDFNDDKKDAGEIGSGHTVTALYEVAMVGAISPVVQAEPLKYSSSAQAPMAPSGDMLTVKLRYKEPAGDVSKKLEFPLVDRGGKMNEASADFRFASAVAEVGQLLRNSEHRQLASWESALSRAHGALGEDLGGYRAEFVTLMRRAQQLVERKG